MASSTAPSSSSPSTVPASRRLDWLLSRIGASFPSVTSTAIDASVDQNATVISAFLSPTPSSAGDNDDFEPTLKLFVYFSSPSPSLPSSPTSPSTASTPSTPSTPPNALLQFSSSASTIPYSGHLLYFLRDASRPLNLRVAHDHVVTWGEVSGPLIDFIDVHIGNIIFPILSASPPPSVDHRHIRFLHRFQRILQQREDELRRDLKLKRPNESFLKNIEMKPQSYNRAAKSREVIVHFQMVVNSWIDALNGFLSNESSTAAAPSAKANGVSNGAAPSSNAASSSSTSSSQSTSSDGPEVEIDYWNRRLMILTSITEQLKLKHCRIVFGVLKAALGKLKGDSAATLGGGPLSARGKDVETKEMTPLSPAAVRTNLPPSAGGSIGVPNDPLYDSLTILMDRWRDVDFRLTDALNEAKDNWRFLNNLRKVMDPLWREGEGYSGEWNDEEMSVFRESNTNTTNVMVVKDAPEEKESKVSDADDKDMEKAIIPPMFASNSVTPSTSTSVVPSSLSPLLQISTSMPSILNSMKMIYTLSRHYGTPIRMTNLFEKITNQLIGRCKAWIYRGDSEHYYQNIIVDIHGNVIDLGNSKEPSSSVAASSLSPSTSSNGNGASSPSQTTPPSTSGGGGASSGSSISSLWNQSPFILVQKLKDILTLYDSYLSQYNVVKANLSSLPNSKLFVFDEFVIFHKFTKFRRRVEKLNDMFLSVAQFQLFRLKRVDGMDELIGSFELLAKEFQLKGHDLLDYDSTQFERDYVEFTMYNSSLESSIMDYIDKSLQMRGNNIEKQLLCMEFFESLLLKPSLQHGLDNKYMNIFKSYKDELNNIASMFDKQKDNPPIPRNMTQIAGNIHWSRQFLRRLTIPMQKFQLSHSAVFHPKESKKIVQQYNKLIKTLIDFETDLYKVWVSSCDLAKKGLRARLLMEDADNDRLDVHIITPSAAASAVLSMYPRLVVNFDHGVLTLIREAKHLQLLGFNLPESARVVLLLEHKLKSYYHDLAYAISLYHRTLSYIPSICLPLLHPHLMTVESCIRPGKTIMTWTSMNIEGFVTLLYKVLGRFDDLIMQINDIITNRIEKNLRFIEKLNLFHFPTPNQNVQGTAAQTTASAAGSTAPASSSSSSSSSAPAPTTLRLSDWLGLQSRHVDQSIEVLLDKNEEVQRAVDDLIQAVVAYKVEGIPNDTIKTKIDEASTEEKTESKDTAVVPSSGSSSSSSSSLQISPSEIQHLRVHYYTLLYQSLVTCYRRSLQSLYDRLLLPSQFYTLQKGDKGEIVHFSTSALFEVELSLVGGRVETSPNMADFKKGIETAASEAIAAARKIKGWGKSKDKDSKDKKESKKGSTKEKKEEESTAVSPSKVSSSLTIAITDDAAQSPSSSTALVPASRTSNAVTVSSTSKSFFSFYDRLSSDSNLSGDLQRLSSCFTLIHNEFAQHLKLYERYSWLWSREPEHAYKEFLAQSRQASNSYSSLGRAGRSTSTTSSSSNVSGPVLEDFVEELQKFHSLDAEIHDVSALSLLLSFQLHIDPLKSAMKYELDKWKRQYGEKLHQDTKQEMDYIVDGIVELKGKLEREVKDFASLKFIMDTQSEIREWSSWIENSFESIAEKYNVLEKYLPFGSISKEEMDTRSGMKTQWTQLIAMAKNVMQHIESLQGGFKDDLIENVKVFKSTVKAFRADYDANGPMLPVSPLEALTRLNKYKREFETHYRKYELYNAGEKLFGLEENEYPELVKTRKELRLLDQLYSLYQQVLSTVDEYKGIPWSEVVANIDQMNETVEQFNSRCRHLPKGVKTWEAFIELNQTINDFLEILPLLTELSKPSMRDRHWKKISKITGKDFDVEKFHEMKLRSVLEANLLQYREDIEEITDSAEKQLNIERKIAEIQSIWDSQIFEFAIWKDHGEVILSGSKVAEIIEQLEDSQASLVQMLTQRHVAPFKEAANMWLKKLSDVNDTLEGWIKVQMLWMNLEAVFGAGDIARQMPQDTRVFLKVDKEWTTRLMNKAKETKNVVECCQNEYIRSMLPTMFQDLEKCQKALDGYLEQKRLKFPRFYFVSNPALLSILSQGTDKEAVQQCFSKVFDAIDHVEFAGNNIVKIRQIMAGFDGLDSEDIILSKAVSAKGNIEDWLNTLLREMRRTVKDIVRAGANDFEAMQWNEFIAKYCAQVTLLGIQFMWTSDVQEALIRLKHDKYAMASAFKKQSAVLTELSSMTTQDIKTKIERTKIETLVTIQVHQRDVLQELFQRYKEKKLKDQYDFEWQKQLRCYWIPEEDECIIRIADVEFRYCYEYLGCKERLVVTPLTDRCYISLSQALGMCFGGSPAGPAGTGKTETVKDLGRALGKYVVVTNCFPAAETRILSDHGFLYLDEARELIEEGETIKWAAYDRSKETIEYVDGVLKMMKDPPSELVNFTEVEERNRWATGSGHYGVGIKRIGGASRLSIRATPNHNMYAQHGSVSMSEDGAMLMSMENTFAVISAEDLAHTDGFVRMQCCAPNGYQSEVGTLMGLPFVAPLGLTCDSQVEAFLEFYGFWLRNGSLRFETDGTPSAIVLRQVNRADVLSFDVVLPQMGLSQKVDWSHEEQRGYFITNSNWVNYFGEMHGDRCVVEDEAVDEEDVWEYSSVQERNEGSHACVPNDSVKTLYEDEITASRHYRAAQTQSPNWFSAWSKSLSAKQMQLIINGLQKAAGFPHEKRLFTSSVHFRDELMVALLHCGYAAYFDLVYSKGDVKGWYSQGEKKSYRHKEEIPSGMEVIPIVAQHDGWIVGWSEQYDDDHMLSSASYPTALTSDGITMESYNSSIDGPLWCVEVSHPDHLLFAQRAERHNGVVTKAGKAIIAGNCSDQMRKADTAKIYKGLAQSGSWGCFDEFNRIDLTVLSVVAQQIQAVFNAIRTRAASFVFPGDEASGEVTLDTECGIFITMNPGYAGRVELPENLKSMFRSVAMMVPDREIIIKVKLASVGYMDFASLAKKFRVLYNLCEEQLSKQRHYDFGLRNILSVLRTAGVNLRTALLKDSQGDRSNLEEMLMFVSLRDMNISKLVADDVDLFISLLHDLFPNQKDPEKTRYDAEEEAMRTVIEESKLIYHESWVNKIVQLYETSLVRHGLMMVGPAGGGKSQAIRVLMEALTMVKDKHVVVRMNPKAIKSEEMFGQNDVISGEWTDGIFSSIWKKFNDPKKSNTWIVCDGPVDAIWIENLNSVLDDNKLLTLANGDRFAMTDNVRLLFEVQDLRNASPATVSRAGIIFVSSNDLGYDPIVQAWLNQRKEEESTIVRDLYARYIRDNDMLLWIQRNTHFVMKTSEMHVISNLLKLLEGLMMSEVEAVGAAGAAAASAATSSSITPSAGVTTSPALNATMDNVERQFLPAELERLFLFSLIWSLGGLLEADDRLKLSQYLKGFAAHNWPAMKDDETLYDYFVDEESLEWRRWESPAWEYKVSTFNFSTCLIPTIDSARAEYLIDTLSSKLRYPVLVVGSSGTAKTSIVLQYTQKYDNSKNLLKKVNFSSATTAGMLQASIEADVEKRQGKTFAPAGGRMMTVFLDDLSMPELNSWGDQPTLEFARQLIETGGFYFLEKDRRGEKKVIENMLYIGAMSHPGGGRNDIPDRLKRHFFTFNMTPPSQESIDHIYGSMLRGKFSEHSSLETHVGAITSATIELWKSVRGKMLPTPSKFHYVFNMRDLARVFQGVLFSPLDVLTVPSAPLLSLWVHECTRVFSDKLTNFKDKQWFHEELYKQIKSHFGDSVSSQFFKVSSSSQPSSTSSFLTAHNSHHPSVTPNTVLFVDFLRDEVVDPETDEIISDAPKIYEPVESVEALRQRAEHFLAQYNNQPGVKPMDLVLFDDALDHLMRISRIVGRPRGNALLVGVGGSGRQSLTRLAAFIAKHDVFQLTITRAYKMADFLEDLRKLHVAVGKDGRKITWILTDFDIVNEEFLEYINAILTTGEVAGLFPKDERDMMVAELRLPARKENPDFIDTPDNLYKYFIDRIRDNLHIVLCFSPANEKFAERARRFPGLISGCTIDWFLRWPEQALVDVSHKFLVGDKDFNVDGDTKLSQQQLETKDNAPPPISLLASNLVKFIATVHNVVTEACDEYFSKFRRRVYVTPKSYLSYIKSFKSLYKSKLSNIHQQQRNVEIGLKKLKEAEMDVGKLQIVLEQQNVELSVAEKAASAMLEKLEVSAKEAQQKRAVAEGIEAKCVKTANQINEEKAIANKELEAAMPFVRAAEKAALSINKKDMTVIQKLGKPPDLIKRIMDCVLILNLRPLVPVEMTEIKTGKNDFQMFVKDSYDEYAKKFMFEAGFIKTLLDFSTEEKDNINEETMEFLEPYIEVSDFNEARARTVSSAAEGLLTWVRAMHSYHQASLVVGPKLEQLRIKSNLYAVASAKLKAAQEVSKAAQDEVDRLQDEFNKTMKDKAALEAKSKETQEKMIAAKNLILSLAGEKKRWQGDAVQFAEDKKKLVGNCALACAFVSYLGPFNYEFRRKLLVDYFLHECQKLAIPVAKDLDLNQFLVDDATIAEWNSQGLPKDELSIQNGILVTQASRYPLLIDPQGQAMHWLKKREASSLPIWGTTTVSNPRLRDQLEFCMENGHPLIIEGVVKEVDPMLDNVLEKNIITKGRSFYVNIGDKQCPIDSKFRLYLVTKLPNPLFSPELSAKTTIIDFSVTQKGLEDQLLSRVIQQEQRSLEEQRQKLIEEVNANTISLQSLDKQLLERLSASQGNLLDDVALISVLADTKAKAQEVKEKIEASSITEQTINKRREHYRPVATRGSVIYFVIVAMAQVNCMYQTSLAQFLQWFDKSLQDAEKAAVVTKRVEILMKHLTYEVYVNIDRGLFEVDKLTFKLMMTLKCLQREVNDAALREAAAATSAFNSSPPVSVIDEKSMKILLRGGAGISSESKKLFDWLQHSAWLNILALSQNVEFYGDLLTVIHQQEFDWRRWYECESPESAEIPFYEDRIRNHSQGSFLRLLCIRCFRDDRTRMAANIFISDIFGSRYVEPFPSAMEDIWRVSDSRIPVILMLTPGADPTAQLGELAKKKGLRIHPVSMGEGQEPYAQRALQIAWEEGGWTLLQNCHLGLGFMEQIEDKLNKANEEKKINPSFRLWITCEPHPDFPIALLQMSVKVTNEPPRGMKAGLMRSYNSLVDADRLSRVETKEWRDLVFVLCFLHSSVQERRKFGPVGWCIPYEFNTGDLEASLTFLEKHCFANAGLSWPTVRYMIGQVQYGGRITDDFDRVLFDTFTRKWLCPDIFREDFAFASNMVGGKRGGDADESRSAFRYVVPSCETIESYRQYISEFPTTDSPEIFGLHVNADLTFGTKEAQYILNTISETQPNESGSKLMGGKTKEELVYEKCEELLKVLPSGYKDDEVRDQIRKRSKLENEFVLGYKPEEKIDGFSIPLNIFLYQEITRLNRTIANVRQTLQDLKSAILGEIIMTPELQQALNFVYNEKPPKHWYQDASGQEIAWFLPSLGLWFQGLMEREMQLTRWLTTTRPITFWLTGFFNPQGFLTATKQEITRRHSLEKWALDDVVLITTVTDHLDTRRIKYPPTEGVYIHGLYLEGAGWDRKDGVLVESSPKDLFTPLPVLLVTAITSKQAEKLYMSKEDFRFYDCPVYVQPKRTNRSYVFSVKLRTNVDPDHWTLRGVALLCSKD